MKTLENISKSREHFIQQAGTKNSKEPGASGIKMSLKQDRSKEEISQAKIQTKESQLPRHLENINLNVNPVQAASRPWMNWSFTQNTTTNQGNND